MAKEIIFLLVDNGIEGNSPDHYTYASFSEGSRNKYYNNSVNKAWLRKHEVIVDIEEGKKKALNKLNVIDKLLLQIR